MPGLLSRLSVLLGSQPTRRATTESRLMNAPVREGLDEALQSKRLQQLENHLFCWLLDTTPAGLAATDERSSMLLGELAGRLRDKTVRELPRQPMTLPMLMNALSDENADRTRLTRIILNDPALTDQLLQIANSPMFRPSDQNIESVDNAVFVLGVDGIRNVISATVMRPMLAARNSREAMFAQRVWRWGLASARCAEQIARLQGQDSSAYFLAGLLPALSYITLHRELHRIVRTRGLEKEPKPSVTRQALARYQWDLSQMLANEWNLPPRYHACLLSAERPAPGQVHTPLTDGIIMGTREVLRHAHQRNMAEDQLQELVQLAPAQFRLVREAAFRLLRD